VLAGLYLDGLLLSITTDQDIKTASEELREILEVGASTEELFKDAYEKAEEILKQAGYDLVDYIYSKTGNEKLAYDLAENAEKLALAEIEKLKKGEFSDSILLTIASWHTFVHCFIIS
jgi:DNA polymerase III gamma/tau subunit